MVNTNLTKYRTTGRLSETKVPACLCRVGPGGFSPTRGGRGFTRLMYSGSLGTRQLGSTTKLLGTRVRVLSSIYIKTTGEAEIPTKNTLSISESEFSTLVARGVGDSGGVAIVGRRISILPSTSIIVITTKPLTDSTLANAVRTLYNSKLSFCSTTTPVISTSDISVRCTFARSECSHNNDSSCVGYPVGGRRCRTFCRTVVGTRDTRARSFSGQRSICRNYVPVRILTSHKGSAVHFKPLGPMKLHSPEAKREP